MSIAQTEAYKKLSTSLDQAKAGQYHLALITVPGMGSSFYLKFYADQHQGTAYINSIDQKLSSFSILDLDLTLDQNQISSIDAYFKQATPTQKIVLVINNPSLWHQEKIKQSYFYHHLYKKYFFATANLPDTTLICQEFGLTSDKVDQIYHQSGGIRKLIKFLCLNPQLTPDDPKLNSLIISIAQVVQTCSLDDLNQLSLIDNNGNFSSSLIDYVFKNKLIRLLPDIRLHPDLNFDEEGITSPSRLTSTEKQILEELVNQTIVSREKIAEIKWGKDSYDDFSDQAITKTIKRLSTKLKKYRIKSLPKTGYQLVLR